MLMNDASMVQLDKQDARERREQQQQRLQEAATSEPYLEQHTFWNIATYLSGPHVWNVQSRVSVMLRLTDEHDATYTHIS